MTKEQAQSAITISALVTTGLYAYRKVTEQETSGSTSSVVEQYRAMFGVAPVIGWGQFLKAAGSIYITLAILAEASPDIGGSFAILVGTASAFGNLVAVRKDLGESEQKQKESATETPNPVQVMTHTQTGHRKLIHH